AEPDSPGTSSGTQAPAGVVRFPGMGGDSTEGAPAEPDAAALSEADQRALAIIQGESQTRSTLAAALGITPQGAGKQLATLTKRGFVVQMEDGRYMARGAPHTAPRAVPEPHRPARASGDVGCARTTHPVLNPLRDTHV